MSSSNGNGNGNGNGNEYATATAEPLATLLETRHLTHLLSEGFTDAQISQWQAQGLRSLSLAEAEELGFRVKTKDGLKSGSGIYFPFGDGFGQLRLDEPIQRENGQNAKYLTPAGAKSKALIPDDCRVITEGAKDAYAGLVHGGIPTGAIAGVSHYRKALLQGSGYTILFDSDGWTNPSVFSNLFHAGKYLEGKIQLVPALPGEPKGGLCEYFKAGYTATDYAALIKAAMKPEALLLAWPEHFGKIPAERLSSAIRTAFRLAAEYLKEVETELLLNGIRKATKLSAALLKSELQKQKRIVQSRLHTEGRKSKGSGECPKDDWIPPTPEPPKPSKALQAIERRASQLLESGTLFDLVKLLVHESGAVGIGDHVQVALASAIGTFRNDRRRSMPVLFTGSSGIGKSMILDALESLLSPGSCIRVSGVSDAVLKRIGDTWKGKIVAIDEFSTWATSDSVLSTLKELISRGEASFEIAVPGESGWSIEHFEVEGPIGIAACATEASIATIFGDAEEEIRSRFNEVPLPEDPEYIRKISRAAFSGLEPENLRKKYPRILKILHTALALALSRKVPECVPLLEDALFQHIQPDRPLFPRLLKRLKILLENTAALLGKSTIDLETYAVVYPLVSKVFRRSLTSENDATLAQFAQIGKEVKDSLAGGYLPFKIPKIQDALSCSKTQAYRLRDKWDSLGWIEGSAYATYAIAPKGIEVLKGAGGDNPGLPEILPPVDKLVATMNKLAESRGISTVFPYLKPSSGKASSDFIPKFSQIFPRFSQISNRSETLINNRFEIGSKGEFSQIPTEERKLFQKYIPAPSDPRPMPDASKEVFPEGSLNLGNLGKPGEEIRGNLDALRLSSDEPYGKTLGKPEDEAGENPVVPMGSGDETYGKTLGKTGESFGKTLENSQATTRASLNAQAHPKTHQPMAPAVDIYALRIGDEVRDLSGRVMQITKLAQGGWLTADGCHVSRDDLKSGTYTLVAPTPKEPTPSESTSVQDGVLILINLAPEINDYEMLCAITQNWTDEYKREVWKLLPPELQLKYKDLKNEIIKDALAVEET